MNANDPEILLTHVSFVRRIARSLLDDSHLAEDVVQETWAVALSRPPRHLGNRRGWLAAVTRSLAFRSLRGRRREADRERRASGSEPLPSAAEVASRLETQKRVVEAVESLAEPYRSTIMFRYFDDLGPTEIASLQGLPVKTVKTRLHRGLGMLRTRLDETYGGDRRAWMLVLLPLAYPGRAAAAAAGTGIAAGGLLLAMKKIAVVLVLLLMMGAVALVITGSDPDDPPRAAPPGQEELSTLNGTSDPESPTAALPVLREGDEVSRFTFAGRVVAGDGAGVRGAEVRLFHWSPLPDGGSVNGLDRLVRRERERHERPAGVTGTDGHFRLDRPYGSNSFLRIRAEGFADAVVGPHRPGQFILVTLGKDAGLRVRVSDEGGRPVPGTVVRLVSSEGTHSQTDRRIITERTTDYGGTAFLPVPTGHGTEVEAVPVDPALGFARKTARPGTTELDLVVPRVRTRTVRIVDHGTGAPAAGAFVIVRRSYGISSFEQQPERRRIPADREGVVRVPVQEGYYGMVATAPGYEVLSVDRETIALRRSMRVRGLVLDDEGRPVVDAALLVALPEGVFARVYAGLPLAAGWSDGEGRFEVDLKQLWPARVEVPDPGVRSLVAIHPAHGTAFLDRLRVEPGRTAEVSLRYPRPSALTVRVTDPAGTPIRDQWVGIGREIPNAETWPEPSHVFGVDPIALRESRDSRTDANGELVFRPLPPGKYRVRVDTTVVECRVEEGEQRVLPVVRGAGAAITGIVLDPEGEPKADVMVGLSGPNASTARTKVDGSFRFEDLEPGEYTVGVAIPQWHGAVSAKAAPGERVILRFPAAPARLEIEVHGPPLGTIEYSLMTDAPAYFPRSIGFIQLPASGEPPAFLPGRGILVVKAKGHGFAVVAFEARAGATTKVKVELPPAGSVEGAVATIPEGKGILVRLVREDGHPDALFRDRPTLRYAVERSIGTVDIYGRLAPDGSFRIGEVPPAVYRLSIGRWKDRKWRESASALVKVRSGDAARPGTIGPR